MDGDRLAEYMVIGSKSLDVESKSSSRSVTRVSKFSPRVTQVGDALIIACMGLSAKYLEEGFVQACAGLWEEPPESRIMNAAWSMDADPSDMIVFKAVVVGSVSKMRLIQSCTSGEAPPYLLKIIEALRWLDLEFAVRAVASLRLTGDKAARIDQPTC